ncbi:L-ectoine synthase [Phytophthora cinnamomi]|uniref:L-ectoine synthase n=1 Tax=Phytophthora cinnamomi TaxID=4785 RepID=UPI003559BDD9|nr:L-ectoine synthase [Phytophthora cinnamomi]
MGKRISDWDIVNVQEDFNYHAFLYKENTQKYRSPTSGGVPIGSGLNTLSRLPFSTLGIERTQWTECSDDESSDCMTAKGFTLQAVQLADGVIVDVYNLHADAGTSKTDQKARASNLQQLGDYITKNSAGNAVIVMGDTNTRYTRSLDTIAEFVAGQNLTDAWVEYVRKGVAPKKGIDAILCDATNMTNKCEVVDKIMYRSGKYVSLKLDKWNNENEAFLDRNGTQLSDHPPISSTFSWSVVNSDFNLSKAFGGPHGTYFTDLALAEPGQTVSSVTIRGDRRVDAVTLEVSDPTESTLSHGGTGGTPKKLALKSGEYITSMEVHMGKKDERTCIFYLKLSTSKGRAIAGGTPTDDKAHVRAPKGFHLNGFYGRAGDTGINGLGAIFTKISSDGAAHTQTQTEKQA